MPRRRSTDSLPDRLSVARERFEEWRSSPERGRLIPDELWKLAVTMAGEFGIFRTARALRLDYMRLKRQVAKTSSESSAGGTKPAGKKERKAGAVFREIRAGAQSATSHSCVLELEDRTGQMMRIHLGAMDAALLTSLVRGFLRGEG